MFAKNNGPFICCVAFSARQFCRFVYSASKQIDARHDEAGADDDPLEAGGLAGIGAAGAAAAAFFFAAASAAAASFASTSVASVGQML